MTERTCGRVGSVPLDRIAARAADHLMDMAAARAVAMSPDGYVTVEAVDDAVPGEVVGVYLRKLGLFALTRLIRGDLEEAINERGGFAAFREKKISRVFKGRKRRTG